MRGHIAEKNGRYYIVVDIGRDHKNRRRQKWFSGYPRKKDAEKDLPRILMKLKKGYTEPKKMLFKDYLLDWLEKKKQDIAHGTYVHYSSYVRNHIIPGLGHWKISELDHDILDSYMDEVKGLDLAQQTKRHIYKVLRIALSEGKRQGIKDGLLDDITAPRMDRKEIEYWSLEEMQTFVKHLKSRNHRIPIMLALATGMRRGEIMGLRWSRVDFSNKTISVTHQLKQEDREGNAEWVISPQLKTETSYRTISIDDDTVEMLKEHKKQQERDKLRVGSDYEDLDLVCSTTVGGMMKPTYLYTVMRRTCEKAKVKRISFHGLRHTHATLLLADGVHPKIVQERLGHRSIETTLDTYSHIIPGIQEIAATSIQRSLHPTPKKEETKPVNNNRNNVVSLFDK